MRFKGNGGSATADWSTFKGIKYAGMAGSVAKLLEENPAMRAGGFSSALKFLETHRGSATADLDLPPIDSDDYRAHPEDATLLGIPAPVYASLAALCWWSLLLGYWLEHASISGVGLRDISRFELIADLALLIETTRLIYVHTLRAAKRFGGPTQP